MQNKKQKILKLFFFSNVPFLPKVKDFFKNAYIQWNKLQIIHKHLLEQLS